MPKKKKKSRRKSPEMFNVLWPAEERRGERERTLIFVMSLIHNFVFDGSKESSPFHKARLSDFPCVLAVCSL
jgi:hypothetical protein